MQRGSTLLVLANLAVGLASAIPAHATFPGKNGRIAFGQFTGPNVGDIFTMNPDGSQLVFSLQASASAPSQLWLMNSDGSNQHLLFDDPSN